MESVFVANARQHFVYEIAELVGRAHVGLARFLIHKSVDEFPFVGVRCLQKLLVLLQKLAYLLSCGNQIRLVPKR